MLIYNLSAYPLQYPRVPLGVHVPPVGNHCSSTWSGHMQILTMVFERLMKASLTLNLAKCDFGKATVTYLGKQVGHGQVRPVEAKVVAITGFPAPTTKCEIIRHWPYYWLCNILKFMLALVPFPSLFIQITTHCPSPGRPLEYLQVCLHIILRS